MCQLLSRSSAGSAGCKCVARAFRFRGIGTRAIAGARAVEVSVQIGRMKGTRYREGDGPGIDSKVPRDSAPGGGWPPWGAWRRADTSELAHLTVSDCDAARRGVGTGFGLILGT